MARSVGGDKCIFRHRSGRGPRCAGCSRIRSCSGVRRRCGSRYGHLCPSTITTTTTSGNNNYHCNNHHTQQGEQHPTGYSPGTPPPPSAPAGGGGGGLAGGAAGVGRGGGGAGAEGVGWADGLGAIAPSRAVAIALALVNLSPGLLAMAWRTTSPTGLGTANCLGIGGTGASRCCT